MKHPLSYLARLLSLSIALVTMPALAAIEVGGVKFPETLQLAGQTLQLNGAGVRVKVIVNLYAAGLYVTKTDADPAHVMGQPGAKVVKIVLLRNLTGEDFADATVKGFKANNNEADVAKFQSELEQIRAMMMDFGPVKKGTVVQIDFVPGKGTHVLLDGKRRGPEVAGDDFQQAVLRIWLGAKPVDADLKQSLLGGK
jgi:chalcone isomerase-like protein